MLLLFVMVGLSSLNENVPLVYPVVMFQTSPGRIKPQRDVLQAVSDYFAKCQ